MKGLCLGTSMWGWSVNKSSAQSILDCFYQAGGRYVDTGYNYPINGISTDFSKSPQFLSEWCKSRGVKDLKIIFKVGSISNSNTPVNDLTPCYLNAQINWAMEYFGQNLHCIMVHWDNRNVLSQIQETLKFLEILCDYNIELGLSGIKYPGVYKKALQGIKMQGLNIQAKHNFLYSGLDSYEELACYSPKFWAYGISVSGLKLFEKEYNENSYVSLVRESGYHDSVLTEKLQMALSKIVDGNIGIDNIYHIGMVFAGQERRLHGYIVAPSTLEQLHDIINFTNNVAIEKIDLNILCKE